MSFLSLLRLAGVPGLILLSSCATQAPLVAPGDNEVWEARRQALSELETWQARGRIAVRTDSDGWSAGFDWRQVSTDYRIRLRGPFGQGALELEGNGHGVWLKRAGQPAVFSADPEALLQKESGWQLPLDGLDHWLRGLPDSNDNAVSRIDAAGRLASLQQHGWQIDYRTYRNYGEYILPARMEMQRNGLRVKVIVDAWELP